MFWYITVKVKLLENYSNNIVFVSHFWSWTNKNIIEMEELIPFFKHVRLSKEKKKRKWD